MSDRCKREEPRLEKVGPDHEAACWHWQEVEAEPADDPLHVGI